MGHICRKYIWFGIMGIGVIAGVWGIDRNPMTLGVGVPAGIPRDEAARNERVILKDGVSWGYEKARGGPVVS
jgi:hypothetical protein